MIKIKYAEMKPVPEGQYVARLDGLEPITSTYGDSVKWTFTIQSPAEHAGSQVTALSSTKVSPKSKMFGWLQAFGVMMKPDEEFDLEQLLGKFCIVRIVNNTKITNVNGQQRDVTFSNVDAIMAYIPPQQNQPPQQQFQSPQNPQTQQNVSPPVQEQSQQNQNLNTQSAQPQPQPNPNPQQVQPQQTQQQNNVVQPNQLNPNEEFDF